MGRWNTLKFASTWLGDMRDSRSSRGGGEGGGSYSPDWLQRMWRMVGNEGRTLGEERRRARCWWEIDEWRASVRGGHVQRKELREGGVGGGGRRAWLINLFTSLKMLQAPFWLNFSLSSIIAAAILNLRSCRYPTLLWCLNPSPASSPHPAVAILSIRHMICITSFLVAS